MNRAVLRSYQNVPSFIQCSWYVGTLGYFTWLKKINQNILNYRFKWLWILPNQFWYPYVNNGVIHKLFLWEIEYYSKYFSNINLNKREIL